MIRKLIKFSFKGLLKNKTNTLINLISLVMGLIFSITIISWLLNELSYDKFNKNVDNIYLIEPYNDGEIKQIAQSYGISKSIKEKFGEIVKLARVERWTSTLKIKDKVYIEEDFMYADPTLLGIFTFDFIFGDSASLESPSAIAISESVALKYFGKTNVLDEAIIIDDGRMNREKAFFVKAIFKDFPNNSTFNFSILATTNSLEEDYLSNMRFRNVDFAFVLSQNNVNINHLTEKSSAYVKELYPDENRSVKFEPLNKFHLYSENGKGDIKNVYYITLTLLIILIMLGYNKSNLSLSTYLLRIKEFGLHKLFGATRKVLFGRIILESIIFYFISLLIAISIFILILPYLNELLNQELIQFENNNKLVWLLIITITFTLSLLSAIFPARFISKYKIISIVRNNSSDYFSILKIRKFIVYFQFILSICLIIITIFIYKQVSFVKEKDIGFNYDNIICLPIKGEFNRNYDYFKNELLKNPDVVNISRCWDLPTKIGNWNFTDADWDGKPSDTNLEFYFFAADYDFFKLLEIDMQDGLSFSSENTLIRTNCILNKEAIKQMEVKTPINSKLRFFHREKTIVGISNDFHFQSLKHKIKPLMVQFGPNFRLRYVLLKINPENFNETVKNINDVWNTITPNHEFKYTLLEDSVNEFHENDSRMYSVFSLGACLAIIIAFIGVYILSNYEAKNRIKEIGIRKILGANSFSIIKLILKSYLIIIVVSSIISSIISYYFINKWISNFAYKIDITLDIFVIPCIFGLIITLLTFTYHVIRAANKNPVDVLKE